MKTWVLKAGFSAAHFYHQKKWSETENRRVFGKCFDPYGHGHDYRLEVVLSSPLPYSELEDRIKAVVAELDHHHLNHVLTEFRDQIPTTENIALYLLKKLQVVFASERLSSIKLFETDRIWVELQA